MDHQQNRSQDDALHIPSEGGARSTQHSLCLCTGPHSLCDDPFGGAFQVISTTIVMRAQPVAWDMHADKHISTEAFQLDYLVIK